MKTASMFLAIGALSCGMLSAQSPQAANPAPSAPIYRVTVIERTMKAVNYQHRNGATKIDFNGTSLLPDASGEAKVESKQGYIEIEVEFDEMKPANMHGAEYLTYVLWAITPEGRTSNLGEILLNGNRGKLNVTTELQAFGLAVTAEPYFAVTMPSNLVVLENTVRADTRGAIEAVDAKYELLERGQYERLANPLALKMDSRMPLELYEARNAIQIARATGADRYASETFLKAEASLEQAEGHQARKSGSKDAVRYAREAVQTAEDSRAIAVIRQEEERLASERRASADREDQARADADAELSLRRQAEAAHQMEAGRRAQAEEDSADAQSETARITREAEAARIAAQTEANRLRRDNEQATREAEAARIASQTEADRLRRENEQATRMADQAEADRLRANEAADRLRLEAEAEKAELRSRLLSQFNTILETRDSARGLIINMSDVLFDTARYSLRPAARERLAKVAGILLGHPGLKLEVEGHTDSVGGVEYNQRLSEQRAGSVRDYLIQEGISDRNSLSATGFGKSQPVATNDTAAGRQLNRRVELVVSGELIGAQIASSSDPQ